MYNLLLRGFLKYPKYERMLTGSTSKSKTGNYYNYYHCTSAYRVRFRAEVVNEKFLQQLQQNLQTYPEQLLDVLLIMDKEKKKIQAVTDVNEKGT